MIKLFYQNISGNQTRWGSTCRSSSSRTAQLLCLLSSQDLNPAWTSTHFLSPTTLGQYYCPLLWHVVQKSNKYYHYITITVEIWFHICCLFFSSPFPLTFNCLNLEITFQFAFQKQTCSWHLKNHQEVTFTSHNVDPEHLKHICLLY